MNATSLRFYVDNVTSFTLDLALFCPADPTFIWEKTPYAPFSPLYAIINTAVTPNTDITWWKSNNATLLVDWVRVYQFVPSTCEKELEGKPHLEPN